MRLATLEQNIDKISQIEGIFVLSLTELIKSNNQRLQRNALAILSQLATIEQNKREISQIEGIFTYLAKLIKK